MTAPIKIAYIKANWHADIVNQTLVGFKQYLETHQQAYELEVFDVPGAFEMPLLAKRLAQRGNIDAVVCAALVVDGGIYRHDFVAQAVVSGLMQVQLETDVPVFSVSLTPHNFQPEKEFTEFYHTHFVKKGAEAAKAVCMVHAIK
ncbi:riboflavin synthase subunit beta [Rouxiella silvae]|uniref:6,7-dimethyl-8-ribityllumazine synthase n=1 Tax=Rouxiella silvae TaxID=1646373 RepID=A0AA41BV94_9GAMM|nr:MULTISPECIES: 6,7-dimethyl-8-ribityllumazine synthase [Rouxiella]KAB7897996.1 6,7-dimethyl-8-ribityllumazine synthase [Rouxiella sp. S1S-2]MBF6635323.1 6,7-dimethyl-8-ribityllumazine synthase [Rouxiella silvae]ORJ21368.1 riboflavin synthase subunit beta [Rouxiella silvae]